MKKILLTIAACFAIGTAGFSQIFSETFESTTGTALPTGWTQSVATGTPNDSVGWNSGTNATLASTYFSPNAHTRFVAVNDDHYANANNTNSFLKSPSFSLASASSAYLSFDCSYVAYNDGAGHVETATVEVSTDGGTTWTVISTLASNAMYWWEPRYINMSAYLGMSNVMLGFRYKDAGGWMDGFAIDNVTVFSPPANDIALTSIAPGVGAPQSYALGGSNISMTGSVFNNGSSTITSYSVNYVFNGGATVSNTISGVSIPAFSSANFTDPTPVTMPGTLGAYPIRMWVSLTGDVNQTNDSSSMDTLNTVSFKPKKRELFEEGTGSWCGYCVRGIIYMDSLWNLYHHDVSIISVHDYNTYDPMSQENTTTKKYDTYISGKIGGYPSMYIDRTYVDDPQNALVDYVNDSANFGFATMDMVATTSGGVVNATIQVTPALNLNGDYRLALVVEEDDVTGTAAGYAQHNYYGIGGSANATPMAGEGYNFNDSSTVITAGHIHFPFVARWTVPNDFTVTPNGVAGSLPASMTAGTMYSYSFSPVTIPSDWVASNLRIVAMLIDNTTGHASLGNVLNTINSQSILTTNVASVNSNIQNMLVYPSPARNEAHVRFELKEAQNIQFSVFDMLGREVLNVPAEQMTAGGQQINFSTATLSSGIYNVVLHTDNGNESGRLSVIK